MVNQNNSSDLVERPSYDLQLRQFEMGLLDLLAHCELPITRRAEFHGLCPWVNENSPVGRQAKLVF